MCHFRNISLHRRCGSACSLQGASFRYIRCCKTSRSFPKHPDLSEMIQVSPSASTCADVTKSNPPASPRPKTRHFRYISLHSCARTVISLHGACFRYILSTRALRSFPKHPGLPATARGSPRTSAAPAVTKFTARTACPARRCNENA